MNIYKYKNPSYLSCHPKTKHIDKVIWNKGNSFDLRISPFGREADMKIT